MYNALKNSGKFDILLQVRKSHSTSLSSFFSSPSACFTSYSTSSSLCLFFLLFPSMIPRDVDIIHPFASPFKSSILAQVAVARRPTTRKPGSSSRNPTMTLSFASTQSILPFPAMDQCTRPETKVPVRCSFTFTAQ